MSRRARLRAALERGPELILTLPQERRRWARVGEVFGEWLMAMGQSDRARLETLRWSVQPWEALHVRLGLPLKGRPDLVLITDAVHALRVEWPPAPPLALGSFDDVLARQDAQNKARVAGNARAIDAALWPLLGPLEGAGVTSLLERAPTGSAWAQATACGVVVEGQDPSGRFDCGMGYIPEGSRRFLAIVDPQICEEL